MNKEKRKEKKPAWLVMVVVSQLVTQADDTQALLDKSVSGEAIDTRKQAGKGDARRTPWQKITLQPPNPFGVKFK